MPHIDICFTEDDSEYSKDTYCFSSLRGADSSEGVSTYFSAEAEQEKVYDPDFSRGVI